MRLQLDRTFFGRSDTSTGTGSNEQNPLKKIASEFFHFVHDLVSLEQAQHDSFTKLEKFIINPETLSATNTLLKHLEQIKDLALPSRAKLAELPHPERQFLTAYMVATKSKFLFESHTDIDELLLVRAQEMLKSFEKLCSFMSELYLKEEEPVASPLAESTPSADRVLSAADSDKLKSTERFLSEGKVFLEEFHSQQMAYYATFNDWEAKNRHKLGKILISKYLEIEAKRFTTLHSLDPRMLELYEAYGVQQDTLRMRIHSLLNEEGDDELAQGLSNLQKSLETKKWIISPSEALIHEIALNPKLQLPAAACVITRQKDLETAISYLLLKSPNTSLILDVLEEIRTHLGVFTPNNRQRVSNLAQIFSRDTMKSQIDTLGLQDGLYNIIYSFIEQIKALESPAHVRSTELYINYIDQQMALPGDKGILLGETVNFIYSKMSQINLELKNFQIVQARGTIAKHIVELEQDEFQQRLAKKQFNLDFTLAWFNKFISSPQEYRLDLSNLCSKYSGTYASHALLIAVLQEPESSVLHNIPETFYLDRLRIVQWHGQYQNLLYTVTALSYLESFCQDYGLKLSLEEVTDEKNKLLMYSGLSATVRD